ncbi:acetylcholine receptor subunit beta-type acr-3-like, partial [Convolutriloba macropyga]|uniref:acetylcholine receptor subunit beta-type acr-3-like n=1 Tax=Convolutriloba macropyga TaxID=536237 RepID=UPI003F524F76
MNAIEIQYNSDKDVFVMFDGLVALKSSLVSAKLACSSDVTHFPFDEQTSSLTSEAFLGYLVESDQWELVRPVKTYVEPYRVPDSQDFAAQVRLRRRPLYFIIVDSGDKISFISTILLAEIVTVSTLNDILPESSLGFPIIAYFILVIIIHLSILCICSVVVNKISQAEKEPNKFIRKAASWPKLKFLRIKPVIANATGISERNLTTVTEVEDIKLEVKPDEIEVTETPSVHK